MVYLMDCDGHGLDSIQDHVQAGRITVLPCPTFQQYIVQVQALKPVLYEELMQGGDPLVVVDTISAIAHTARMDHKLGLVSGNDMWDKREQYYGGDKNYLNVYDYSTDGNTRLLKDIRSVEVTFNDKNVYVKNPPAVIPPTWTRRRPRLVVCAHESEQDDVTVGFKKRAPHLHKALFKSLEANCSDMFRLTAIEEPMMNEDGQTVRFPADTRFLTIRKTDDCITKFQVQREFVPTLPAVLVNPTMRKLWKVLHKKPSLLVLYGPPGVGKTTLAVSEVEPIRTRRANESATHTETKEAQVA